MDAVLIIFKFSLRGMFGKKDQALEQRKQALYARTEEYKAVWDKGGIIQFKNERIAILKREMGAQVEFIIAFDDITAEGYELKAIDGGKEAAATNFGGGISSYYYFQKGL
jgi:hypothetical protein